VPSTCRLTLSFTSMLPDVPSIPAPHRASTWIPQPGSICYICSLLLLDAIYQAVVPTFSATRFRTLPAPWRFSYPLPSLSYNAFCNILPQPSENLPPVVYRNSLLARAVLLDRHSCCGLGRLMAFAALRARRHTATWDASAARWTAGPAKHADHHAW